MDRKRSYEDGCAFAQALDLVGERWAMLVMRELMFGPRRFTDLKAALPGIATNVLAQRLAGLEAAGVLRRVAARAGRARAYELTPWGYAFREPLRVMGSWAARSPLMRFDHPLSAAAAMLSLASMFDPARARGVEVAIDARLPDGDFALAVRDGRLSVEAGRSPRPDAVVAGPQMGLLGVLYMGADPAAAGLAVTGDAGALGRLAATLGHPEPLLEEDPA